MLQIQSGELLRDCGSSLKKKGYTIKVLNLDEKSHSNHYNPIVYVKKQETFYDVLEYEDNHQIQEDDVMTLINTLIILWINFEQIQNV